MNIVLKSPICKSVIPLAANYGIESKIAECPHCHNKDKIKTCLPKLSIKVGTDLNLNKQKDIINIVVYLLNNK